MNEPFFSVVIPTYNQAFLLEKAIKSVIQQEFNSWELLIIDNTSTDNTQKVINKYKSHQIKSIVTQNNGVIAKSRNLGILNSTGKYVAFLDSDDQWNKIKLKRVYETLLEHPNSQIICHNEIWMKDGEVIKSKKYGPTLNTTYEKLLLNRNALSTSAVVIERKILISSGLFSEETKYATVEDYDLWLKLSKNNSKFHFIDENLGIYLIHDNNSSKAIYKHFVAEYKLIKDHFREYNAGFIHYLMLAKRLVRLLISTLKSSIK